MGIWGKIERKHTHFVTIMDIRFFARGKRGFLLIKRCCFLEEGDLQALAPVYSKRIRKEGISFVCGDKMTSHTGKLTAAVPSRTGCQSGPLLQIQEDSWAHTRCFHGELMECEN